MRADGKADWDWPWSKEIEAFRADPSSEMYAVVDSTDRLHAMMSLRFEVPAQVDKALDLVYIERLAVAPWNRPEKKPRRELIGVGGILLAQAVLRSIAREYGGRVGLHSLPDPLTEAFYAKAGMEALFRDPQEQNELYFEFTELTANRFLERSLEKA